MCRYKQLSHGDAQGDDKQVWIKDLAKEFRILLNGIGKRMTTGIDTIKFII